MRELHHAYTLEVPTLFPFAFCLTYLRKRTLISTSPWGPGDCVLTSGIQAEVVGWSFIERSS